MELRNNLYQATPKRSTYLYTFQNECLCLRKLYRKTNLSLERMDIWYRMSFYLRDHGFNPDQHPNLIALSLTFDERVTRVEVSVCLLSLKHLLHLYWPKMSSSRMLTPIDHSNISHRWASYTAGMITKKNHICRDSHRLSTCMVFNSGIWTDSTDYCGYTDETTPK